MRDKDFIHILEQPPFNTSIEVEFPTSLQSVVRWSQKIRSGAILVDITRFIELVDDHIDKLSKRKKELLEMKKVLDDQGTTIE